MEPHVVQGPSVPPVVPYKEGAAAATDARAFNWLRQPPTQALYKSMQSRQARGRASHLVARVHIQQMCKHHEARSSGDVAVILVLLQCGREGHVKEQDPWDADLSPHLQIQRANLRGREPHALECSRHLSCPMSQLLSGQQLSSSAVCISHPFVMCRPLPFPAADDGF